MTNCSSKEVVNIDSCSYTNVIIMILNLRFRWVGSEGGGDGIFRMERQIDFRWRQSHYVPSRWHWNICQIRQMCRWKGGAFGISIFIYESCIFIRNRECDLINLHRLMSYKDALTGKQKEFKCGNTPVSQSNFLFQQLLLLSSISFYAPALPNELLMHHCPQTPILTRGKTLVSWNSYSCLIFRNLAGVNWFTVWTALKRRASSYPSSTFNRRSKSKTTSMLPGVSYPRKMPIHDSLRDRSISSSFLNL